MKFKYIFLVISILFIGCGSGGGETSDISSSSTSIEMKKGNIYYIYKGDKIIKKDEDTKISIEADINTKKTTATLISGKAEIRRY